MTDVIDWPIIKDDVSRGGPLAMLLLGSAKWVHRRVDSLTLGQSGTTRRSVSFDLTVPTELQVPLAAEVQVLVPLALVEKGALRKVTAKDPSGHPLPILGAQDNSRLSAEMLLFMLDATPGGLAAGYDEKLFALLQQVVAFQPGTGSDEERTRLEAGIAAAAQAKGYPADVSELIEEIAKGFLDHFLLVAVLDSDLVGQRAVLKFCHAPRDLPTPSHWNRIGVIDFTMPDVGLTRSQHVEFEAPAGLIVKQLKVTETFAGKPVRDPLDDTPDKPRASAHVAFTPLRSTSGAFVRVRVAPAGAGILSFTVVAAVALAVVRDVRGRGEVLGLEGFGDDNPSVSSRIAHSRWPRPVPVLDGTGPGAQNACNAAAAPTVDPDLLHRRSHCGRRGRRFPAREVGEGWGVDCVPIAAGAIIVLLIVYMTNGPRGAAKA